MKFKVKATVAALAMMAAGGANAAINPGSTSYGELFFSVFDSVNQISYSRDLGITVDSFLTNAASNSYTVNVAADSMLQTFISNANASSSTMVWNLMGAKNGLLGSAAENSVYGLYLTSKAGDAAVGATAIGQLEQAIYNVNVATAPGINGNAATIYGDAAANYGLNRSTTATSGAGYYGDGSFGDHVGAAMSFGDAAKVGESMAFYHLGVVLDADGQPVPDADFNNTPLISKFLGQWTLAANGDLSYGVAGGPAPAPVPLPPAVLLLGSALAGLVGVARRNRQQEETLTA